MICNFCGKTLSDIDEDVLGEQRIVFPYGSKRDGDLMNFVVCSNCIDKLADEFISRCKHEPKIIPFGAAYPDWKVKSTEESGY